MCAKKLSSVIAAGLLSLASHQVSATIVSGVVTGGSSFNNGGVFVKLGVPFTESTPDNTVGDNNFNDFNLYGFDESQNINLAADLTIDILADGIGGGSGSGVISAGTIIASHYIFFDPASLRTQIGDITFDSNILGIITSSANLNDSDFLANTGVNYLSPGLRGLEGGDTVSITGLDTLSVNWSAGSPGDYIRVLTATSPSAVPVPAAVWLFGSGLVGLVGVARRRKAA